MRWKGRAACRECGGTKEPGRGNRYCADCRLPRHERYRLAHQFQRAPCQRCKGPKQAGRGRILCDDCQALAWWRRERRHLARTAMKRQPCRGCGGRKEDGLGRLYCDKCRAERLMHPCRQCGRNNIPRAPVPSWLCDECRASPERTEALRTYWREQKRLYRLDPVKRARMDARSKAYQQAKRATAKGKAQLNEAARFNYHLRHGELTSLAPHDSTQGPPLPSLPLAMVIDRLAARASWNERFDDGVLDDRPQLKEVCERAGVDPRAVFAWRVGERTTVGLHRAIEILDALDLMWWEVWTEDTMRIPERVERSYQESSKGYPTLRRTVLIGDLGPDLEGLEAVRVEMERVKPAARMAA